jgi:hypothetical protein
MKYLTYIILLVLLGICLFSTKEKFYEIPHSSQLPGIPSNLKIEESTRTNNTIKITWGAPTSPDDDILKGYLIMLKKATDTIGNGMYINFKLDGTSCTNKCRYILNNLNLVPNTNYIIGVMGFNNRGTGPVASANFLSIPLPPTPSPSATNSNSTTSNPNPTSSSSSTSSTSSTSSNIDRYVNNMISRAEGVYEWENNDWKYPDTYEYDVKQSLKVLNDKVKQDLQEYRIAVHLGTTKST